MRPPVLIAWVCAAATWIGFVLPWVHVEPRAPELLEQLTQTTEGQTLLGKLTGKVSRVTATVRRGAETVTGDLSSLQDLPRQINGIQVPRLANDQRTKVAMALVELFMGTAQGIGWKSSLVYLLPGLATLAAALLMLLGGQPRIAWGVAGVSLLICAVGSWKLATAVPSSPLLAVAIGPGLWVSMAAYGGLAFAGGWQAAKR